MSDTLGMNFLSGLVAGNTGAMFWTAFSLMGGPEPDELKTVGLGAVILFFVGTISTTVIAQVISARKQA